MGGLEAIVWVRDVVENVTEVLDEARSGKIKSTPGCNRSNICLAVPEEVGEVKLGSPVGEQAQQDR